MSEMNAAWWERLGRQAWDLPGFLPDRGLVLGPDDEVVTSVDLARDQVWLGRVAGGTRHSSALRVDYVRRHLWPDFRESASYGVLEAFGRRHLGEASAPVRMASGWGLMTMSEGEMVLLPTRGTPQAPICAMSFESRVEAWLSGLAFRFHMQASVVRG